MIIGAPKELFDAEARVALTPDSAAKLQKLGYICLVESGAGIAASIADSEYEAAGVTLVPSANELWRQADIIVKVREPSTDEIDQAAEGKTLISFFNPAANTHLLEQATAKKLSVLAMDMIPRISRAQKMDALSSMSNIAGYRAVIEASNNFGRFFMGQMTAAGKVAPARVLVVGAGVAGLAAIGTSVSLGAITQAFDVRPEVSEQIESMGAEFVFLEFDENQAETGSSSGYAAPSSPEFREKQLEKFAELAPTVDIVITTALIPNQRAPQLWTADMVASMKRGSVVVDLAAERGGNCELTQPGDKVTTENGVTIIGYTDLPSRMATQSSNLYANNIRHMIDDLTPTNDGNAVIDMEDDVIRGALVTHNGEVTWPPPAPKKQAIAPAAPKSNEPLESAEERAERLSEETRRSLNRTGFLLGIGGVLCMALGTVAPSSFMQHFIVFVLSIFVGFHVIWEVSHSLHTPLMAITNSISSIIIVGALLQFVSSSTVVTILASLAIVIASVNIFGGFLVTHRMLAMFKRS